jgi:cell division protein FtsW
MFSCGLVVLLILASGSLSATVITGTLVGGLAFIAGVRIRYLLIPVMAGVALVVAVLYVDAERLSRVTSFRDPESIQRDGGYQLWRSQLALGSGGWTGVGFTKSRMKQSYLPEAHTDCIVSIIGEELGFVAVMGVIGAYLLVIVCGAVLAVTASDRLGLLICSGVTLVFAIQVFVNISVVSGFGPTTGVTAPLISYGGSSVVVSLASIGLMLGVAQRTERAALRSVEFGPEGATTAPGALARRNRAPLLSASGSVGQRMGVRG